MQRWAQYMTEIVWITEAEDIKKRWQEYTGRTVQKRSSQPR